MTRSKKILIIGAKGMLGSQLCTSIKKDTDWLVYEADRSGKISLDITNEDDIITSFAELNPDVVINCAAFTNVDSVESGENYELAMNVNGIAPGMLMRHCRKNNADFVHISSDYVFGDNNSEGYNEDYQHLIPLNKYGDTKLRGEQTVAEEMGGKIGSDFGINDPRGYVVRTSWLFGKGAQNFLPKIIKYAQERDYLEVVTDEVSSPTYVKDLSEQIIYILKERPKSGIYHMSGEGKCSRYDFAKEILTIANIDTEIRETKQANFDRTTKIPEISYLINTKLPKMRKWEEMVKEFILENKEELVIK